MVWRYGGGDVVVCMGVVWVLVGWMLGDGVLGGVRDGSDIVFCWEGFGWVWRGSWCNLVVC